MSNNPPPVDEVFDEAVRRGPGEERERYLAEACGDDAELKQRVERLLRAVAEAGSFLESPAQDPSPTLDQPITEKPGTQIGPYKLLQQLGEGGMGVVYMAEQKEPVKRRVALKIIKPGMDTRQVIARFEAERQALAMMDHPNIAKVLDAGQTESGRPYFVMELVKGVPVTKYCDEQHLTPKERLELFVPICQAVQHAHQKGIIHRDLKPSNILVALYDGQAVPKIIDFGVAKATSQTLTEKTMFTHVGQVVGTLEYMSPEQAQVNQLDVDTRSDIYSLGVVLYELLTGETPFDRQRLRSAAFDEMLRIIREEEPSKPSTKVSSSQSLPSIAANRRIEPAKLGSMIRGELDWIVLKAMEKDRGRRYETASKFAEDVQHYLNDEEVVACPPSRLYRWKKLVRRHKSSITVSATVALALFVGSALAAWQAIRAIAAERDAKSRAKVAEAVVEFLTSDLLAQADPFNEPDRDIRLQTVLDRASLQIEQRFHDQPEVEEELHRTLGRTYKSLGELEKALHHLERARRIHTQHISEQDDEALTLEAAWWAVQGELGNDAAIEHLLEIAETQEQLLGSKHPDAANTRRQAGSLLVDIGRRTEAEQLLKEAFDTSTCALGPEHPDTLLAALSLSYLYYESGRYSDCETILTPLIKSAISSLGELHPTTLCASTNLGATLDQQLRPAEAEAVFRRTLPSMAKVYGEDHRRYLELKNNLGVVLQRQGKVEEAQQTFQQVLRTQERSLGNTDPDTIQTVLYLIKNAGAFRGDFAAVEQLARRHIHRLEQENASDPKVMLGLKQALATALYRQNKDSEAAALYEDILAFHEEHDGLDSYEYLGAKANLVGVLHPPGPKRREAYEEVFDEMLTHVPEHNHTWTVLRNLYERSEATPQQQESYLRRYLEVAQKHLSANDLRLIETKHVLARFLKGQSRLAEAAEVYREVYEGRKATCNITDQKVRTTLVEWVKLGVSPGIVEAYQEYLQADPSNAMAHNNYGLLLELQDQPDEALSQYQKAVELDETDPMPLTNAGRILVGQGKFREAEDAYRSALRLNKDDVSSQLQLAWCLIQLNQNAKAGQILQTVVGFPNEDYVFASEQAGDWVRLGYAFYRDGDFEKCVQAFEKADALSSDDPLLSQSRLILCMSYCKSGQHQRAAEEFINGAIWARHNLADRKQFGYIDEAVALLSSGDTNGIDVALTQINRQIEREPDNLVLRVIRARLHIERQEWDKAATDWVAWIDSQRAGRAWNSPRVLACWELANWPEVFERVAAQRPEETCLWIGSAQCHAMESQWSKAARDLARVNPTAEVDDLLFEHAALLVLRNEDRAFAELCQSLVSRVGEQASPGVFYNAARSCCMSPKSEVDPALALQWARQSAMQSRSPWYLHVLGLAQHRAGQFDEAISVLDESNAGTWGTLPKMQNDLVIAMCHEKAGRHDVAEAKLKKAQSAIHQAAETQNNLTLEIPPPDWTSLAILLRQAKELIEGAEKAAGPKAANQ